jgi:hypothetical protein
MRDGKNNQSPVEARKLFEDYVRSNLKSCRFEGLSRAIHAVQDYYAGGHSEFQPWTGKISLKHIWDDVFVPLKVRQNAINATRMLINKFDKSCNCAE